jgi:cytochrome c-type biogenesis protein CcmH/NrfG
MGIKKLEDTPTIAKKTAMIFAAITLLVGFFAGAGFTVYKTKVISGTAAANGQYIDYAQRAKILKAKLEKDPDNTERWVQLGHIYFDSDQYNKAIQAYEKSLGLDPNNADVLTDLGIMYRRSNQPRKAIEQFDQAIAIDPKHETARFNKGIVLLHDLKDKKAALRSWEELLEVNPLAMAGKDMSVDQMLKHYKEGHDKNNSK